MKAFWIIPLFFSASCTLLSEIESRAVTVTTNTVVITNTSPDTWTNVIITTNVIVVSESVIITNIVTNTSTVWLSTNTTYNQVLFMPLPSTLNIYVDSAPHSAWADPRLYFWYEDGNGDGDFTREPTNITAGAVTWWVFRLTNMDVRRRFGLKLHNGPAWTAQEPIKTENGKLYDRIVSIPLLSRTTVSISNTPPAASVTSTVVTVTSTPDSLFVLTPLNWYESYPYLYDNETNVYGNAPWDPWDGYMGATYMGSGITRFVFYAPNVRRAWVGGDFNGWQRIPMKLSYDRVFWWAEVSNTAGGQAYKYAIEKTGDTNIHWISDLCAAKNEYGPAMNTAGNRSFIVDHGAFQWNEGGWSKPGFEYYSIYQMHMKTFETNGPGSYWGRGTFVTATNRFDYIKDLGFTAIEPLPINEFAGDDSWGYNYTLFYAPETAYCGTNMADITPLKVFVNTAHQKGLAVILDLVFNHMGASDDILGGIDPARDWQNPQTYWYSGKTDWGPRFNYANPVVKKFLTDSACYFAEHYRVDGFRFDATEYIFFGDTGSPGGSFIFDMTRTIKSRAVGNILLIAENLPNRSWITESTGAAFNYQWNADMAHSLKKLFKDGPGAFNIPEMAGLVTGNCYGGWAGLNYMVSHDEAANGKQRTAADLHYVRSFGNSEYDAQGQQLTGLATVLMAQGIPMMLMGDEFLEGFYDDAYWGEPRNARWFTDAKYLSWNFEVTNTTPARWGAWHTRNAVRDLAWVRRNNPAIYYPGISSIFQDNINKVLGFQRGGNIYVVINYDKKGYTAYNPGIPSGNWSLIYAHPSSAYGHSWADSFLTGTANGGQNIRIPEYGVLVYRKN